jgi:hypothetical protein
VGRFKPLSNGVFRIILLGQRRAAVHEFYDTDAQRPFVRIVAAAPETSRREVPRAGFG